MKKKDQTWYFVTDVASVPVYKVASKTEMHRMATKPGWGAVEWYSAADGYKNRAKRCARQRANSIAQSLDNFFQRSKYFVMESTLSNFFPNLFNRVHGPAAAGKGVAPTPIRLRPMAWRRRMSPVNSYGLV